MRVLATYREDHKRLKEINVELLKSHKDNLTELEQQLYKTNISEEKDILSIKIGSLKQAIAKAEWNK